MQGVISKYLSVYKAFYGQYKKPQQSGKREHNGGGEKERVQEGRCGGIIVVLEY